MNLEDDRAMGHVGVGHLPGNKSLELMLKLLFWVDFKAS